MRSGQQRKLKSVVAQGSLFDTPYTCYQITMPEEETADFDYQGYLIFNGVYKTELHQGSEYQGSIYDAESKLLDDLGRFKNSQRNSDRGLEKLLLRDFFRDDDSVSGELEELANSLIAVRFLYEDRIEKEAYVSDEAELQMVEIPVVNDADIYWNYPDYMYFRGAKNDVAEAIDYTSSLLGADVTTDGGTSAGSNPPTGFSRFSSISFHADFLLWLFQLQFNDNDPPVSAIEIDTLTDAAVTGDADVWGGNNVVGDTSELVESPPLLSAILQNKSLKMIEGGFAINENTLQSEIQINKVHVKSSVKSVKKANDTRRMALSIQFLNELVELEDYWDNLDPQDKYPSYDFFLELFDTCRDQGMTLDSISETLRREYCNKRGDPDDVWDL